ncbi:hypothetical protein, partial [Microbulbifer sp. 2205BS26-8]
CLVSPERLRPILLDESLDEFRDQIQGCMWLTGRKWWHFVLYCPALKNIDRALTVRKMERDDNYIDELETDLLKFDKLVDQYRNNLTEQAA